MDRNLQDKLFKKYPMFFKHKNDLQQSLMGFGFECGNGWYPLISKLCHDIHKFFTTEYDTKDYQHMVPPYFNVQQVKEKFGSLRFYVSSAPTEVFDMIHEAEKKSYYICEECGKEGKKFYRDNLPWIRTLCDDCLDKHVLERWKHIRKAKEDYISDWQKEHNAPFVEMVI